MSLSDVLSTGAIAVSVLTFVVTIYEQYLKAAKLQLVLGTQMRFPDGGEQTNVDFWAGVAIANQGAVDAVILDINGTLTNTNGASTTVDWYTFGDLDPTKGTFVAKGWTETLIASSRKATTTWIGFSTKEALAGLLVPGLYSLQLTVLVPVSGIRLLATFGSPSATRRTAVTWTGTFELTAEQIERLKPRAAAEAAEIVGKPLVIEVTGAERWLRRQSATAVLPGAKESAQG